MSNYICQSCRSSLIRPLSRRSSLIPPTSALRSYSSNIPPSDQASTTSPPSSKPKPFKRPSQKKIDINALLSTPTWSVRSLLPFPTTSSPSDSETITPTKLHHLLRLSALPLPKSPEEEARMLDTLHQQLYFVRAIQSVNTDGVKPLQSIRDETDAGIKEITIGLESKEIKEALAKEEVRGRMRRPRRKRSDGGQGVRREGVEDWDVLGTAGSVVERAGGRYFVVRSGKGPHVQEKGYGGNIDA